MRTPKKLKFTIIGAGSVCFCPATISDILLNERICSVPLKITLMDIAEDALKVSKGFAREAIRLMKRDVQLESTTCLEKALEGADFVVSAIEVDRYYYWSMDFHIPRRYGFRQVYGENGGPGSMFHTLRNLPPTLEIARAMERICPDAWLLNYTNPEAKLVEGVSRLTRTKVVGLCHGEGMGMDQLSQILEIPRDDIDGDVAGLNHFGWFTRIQRKSTGEDLYGRVQPCGEGCGIRPRGAGADRRDRHRGHVHVRGAHGRAHARGVLGSAVPLPLARPVGALEGSRPAGHLREGA